MQSMRKAKTRWLSLLVLLVVMFSIFQIGETNALFTDEEVLPVSMTDTAILEIGVAPVTALFNVSNLIPGDRIPRTVTLSNTGTVPYTYDLTVTSNTSSILFTDTTDGLQMEITDGATVLYSGPMNQPGSLLPPDLQLNPTETKELAITVSFPVTAGNIFQNVDEEMEFTFTATQLPGTDR